MHTQNSNPSKYISCTNGKKGIRRQAYYFGYK